MGAQPPARGFILMNEVGMELGFVAIWRKLMNTSFYKIPNTCHLAVHCLIRANHKPEKVFMNGALYEIKAGEFISGRKALSKETGLTERGIRTSLGHLIKCDFLTIEPTKRFTRFLIVNYADYQAKVSNRMTNKRPTSDQLTTTDNHNKHHNHNKQITTSAEKTPQLESTAQVGGDMPIEARIGDITEVVRQVANKADMPKDTPKTIVAPKERQITPMQKVVRAYKRLIEIPEDDASWDRAYWARYSKCAKTMLDLFSNDLNRICECMIGVSDLMKEKKLDWTFETIVKRAGDWKRDHPKEVK